VPTKKKAKKKTIDPDRGNYGAEVTPTPLPAGAQTVQQPYEWIPEEYRRAAARREGEQQRQLTGRRDLDLTQPVPLSITDDELKQILVAIVRFDPRRLLWADGCPRNIEDLDDDTAMGLQGVEVQELWGRDAAGTRTVIGLSKKYKQADRLKAIELLMRNRKLLDGEGGSSGDMLADVVEAIQGSWQNEYGRNNKGEAQHGGNGSKGGKRGAK